MRHAYLERVILERLVLLLELVLEIAAVEAHLELGRVARVVFDEVHRLELFLAKLVPLRLVAVAELGDGQLGREVDFVPFPHVLRVLCDDEWGSARF